MLQVTDLHATVLDGQVILKGIDLDIQPGEIHAIMGPNGSGKSTLSRVLAGHPGYTVTGGTATFLGKDLLTLSPNERAGEGLFMGFQYPVEIPGVNNVEFLRMALDSQRSYRKESKIEDDEFQALLQERMQWLAMDTRYSERSVNEGFSGGEKKRNEILQMAILQPRLALLDETDSGLDIDALRVVADGVNRCMSPDRAVLLVTHYQRLLDYVKPHKVHVLRGGRIVLSGGPELALELEKRGYDWITG